MENVWQTHFTPQRRRQVGCARRRGLRLRRAHTLDDFRAHFELYADMMRERCAQPILPYRLFEQLARCESPGVQLWVAEHAGQIIASNLAFFHGAIAISWSGAMRRAHAAYHPTVALHHATAREACAQGCRAYHLGASPGLPGVARFKEQFGCDEGQIHTWTAPSPLGQFLGRLRPPVQLVDRLIHRRQA
jgi:lipid II:glycine glycyltransferase (peptidoglycan interpeptide bridge formation enzyme)